MSRKNWIDWDAIDRMLRHPSEDFAALANAANLDPAIDFIGADLREVDFGQCDLKGFVFRNANLESADLRRARNVDECLQGARNLEKAKLPVGVDPSLLGLKEHGPDESEADPFKQPRRPRPEYIDPNASSFGERPGVFSEAPVFEPSIDPEPIRGLAEVPAGFEFEPGTINDLPSPPAGWTWLDKASLDAKRKPLDDDELSRFFDGILPQWRHALSERIPRRDVVLDAAALLRGAEATPPRAVFLEGAGGEGKSTAFRQIIAQLLEDDPRWLVLWRENDFERMTLPKDFVEKLPKDGRPILIATDEAQNVARNLLAFVEEARAQDVGGVHVLIAARDTDWRAADPQQKRWEEITDFHEKRLRGVSEADAGRIVDAWSHAGRAGSLAGLSREEAVSRFVQVSRDEERKFGEGALLGAMIELRMAEGFSGHVRSLLRRLDEIRAPGGSLLHAYAHIAAMHAENLRFLSTPVLAHLLGCDETTLTKDVIRPLADEAAGQSHGGFILTRHRRIAEVAMEILEEEGENRFAMLVELAVGALRMRATTRIPEYPSWIYEVGKHLIRRQRNSDAIILARRFLEIEPDNIHYLVNLARTLRETGDAKAAVDVFREAPEAIVRNRVFYYEWGTAAGSAGDHALDVWLAGVSLSDAEGLPRLDADRVKLSLTGLGVACKELYESSGDRTFLRARGAAGQLGLRIPGIERDTKASSYFRRYQDEAAAEGIEAMSVEAAVQAVEDAVLRAFDLSDVAEDLADEGVPYRDEIYFRSLRVFPWRRD